MPRGRLSLGTAQLGMLYGIVSRREAPSEAHAVNLLEAAIDLGIDCLDTAAAYGLAEQRIGAFLTERALHDRVAVCTKLSSLRDVPATDVAGEVEQRLTLSLQRLCTNRIDSVLLHDAGDLSRHGEALVAALVAEQVRGRVVDIGVSVYSPHELAVLERHPELNVVQHPFNLLDRRLTDGDWPSRLARQGVKLQLRSVLLQGVLAAEPAQLPETLSFAKPVVKRLHALLAELGVTPLEIAVAFAAALEPDRIVIAADSTRQLETLVAAAGNRVPPDLAALLEAEIGAVPGAIIDPRLWPQR